MSFDLKNQFIIKNEIEKLLNYIFYGVVNTGFAQRVEEQRISQEIETYSKTLIIKEFKSNKKEFIYLKEIKENNGSTKAPYELLLNFEIENIVYDVFVDFKPINILKKSTAPYMGSINKYISRINDSKFYDVFLIVRYESKVDTLPVLKSIDIDFVKDITNYSLYNNWQLQLTIHTAQIKYGRNPVEFKKDLINLLENMKTKTVKNIVNKCDKLLESLN